MSVIGGLLVQFVPSPTDWVFAVLTVVFLLAARGVVLLPETSPRRNVEWVPARRLARYISTTS